MEISRLGAAWEQVRDAFVVVYSLGVMSTIIPALNTVPRLILVPYFLFIPGYYVTLILKHTESNLEKLFYTFAWSIAIFASVYSLASIPLSNQFPPVPLIVPSLTIVLLVYVHYHHKGSPGA